MRIFEVISGKTITLYRGDAAKVDKFETEQTTSGFNLFGKGIYLTDNPIIAKDYTLKGSEGVVYTDENATTSKEFISSYLHHLMENELGFKEFEKEFYRTNWSWDASEEEKKEYKRKINAEYQSYMKKAKDLYRKRIPDLKIVKDTMGEFSLIKKGGEGYVTAFDVPVEYLKNVIDAEAPMTNDALEVFKTILPNGPDSKYDLRNKENVGGFTFNEWVEIFKKEGTRYAWRDDIVGGKGMNPSFDEIRNGTHMGGSLFHDKEFEERFIQHLQNAGFVGLKYQGGIRVGAYTRGGGGIKHTAYILWDSNMLNTIIRNAEQVSLDDLETGMEKGIRTQKIDVY